MSELRRLDGKFLTIKNSNIITKINNELYEGNQLYFNLKLFLSNCKYISPYKYKSLNQYVEIDLDPNFLIFTYFIKSIYIKSHILINHWTTLDKHIIILNDIKLDLQKCYINSDPINFHKFFKLQESIDTHLVELLNSKKKIIHYNSFCLNISDSELNNNIFLFQINELLSCLKLNFQSFNNLYAVYVKCSDIYSKIFPSIHLPLSDNISVEK